MNRIVRKAAKVLAVLCFLPFVYACSGAEDMLAQLPPGWQVVENDEFVMAVPPTLEEATLESDVYSYLKSRGHIFDFVRTFYPKGMGKDLSISDTLLCSVSICDPSYSPRQLFWERNYHPHLNEGILQEARLYLLGGIYPEWHISGPDCRMIRISGKTYAMEGKMLIKLPDADGSTAIVGSYILQDKRRGTMIYYVYREREADYWEEDMDYMIHTFRWK